MHGTPSLNDAKRKVAEHMLGRHGVHGIGLRRGEGAIALYWDPGEGGDAAEIRAKAGALAKPFGVMLIEGPTAIGPRQPTE